MTSVQVKDLEVELETTKQKNKENLQQAILLEHERVTQMQWEMEELRRKSLELEWKLKSGQVIVIHCLSSNFLLIPAIFVAKFSLEDAYSARM